MNFEESVNYLDKFSNYEKRAHELKARFSLEPVRELAARLGNPQNSYPAAHVAGTVGKGSVCFMLEAALEAAGFKTALYTSPHLNDIRERLRIGGRTVSHRGFTRAVSYARVAAREHFDRYTYFEVLTAGSFALFAAEKVDIAIIETGLGGRLDATNIVNPLVSVITTIGWDHQDVLGRRLCDIAREKAGIIKPGVDTVSAPQKPSAMKVIASACARSKSELYVARPAGAVKLIEERADTTAYEVSYQGDAPLEVELPLAGGFQRINLAVALRALERLSAHGFGADPAALRCGLAGIEFSGRMERFERGGVEFILDGAHNATAAAALAAHLAPHGAPGRKIILVVGMMRDKDHDAVLRELSAVGGTIVVCGLPFERAWPAARLAPFAARHFSKVIEKNTMEGALRAAALAAGRRGRVCVTGSLYAVAEARAVFQRNFGLQPNFSHRDVMYQLSTRQLGNTGNMKSSF